MKGIAIIGTGTGVGKTAIAAGTMRLLSTMTRPRYWKAVETGSRNDDDTAEVRKLSGLPSSCFEPPAYRFREPMSPHLAARLENREISRARLAEEARRLQSTEDFLVVETAGGVLVPLAPGFLQIDFLADLRLPVCLVALDQLGTINHTLLTLEACRARGIRVLGVVLNRGPVEQREDWLGHAEAIANYGKVPVLARLPEGNLPDLIDAFVQKVPGGYPLRFDARR